MTKYVSKENLELYDSKLKEYINNSFNNVEERYAYGIEWDVSNAKPYRVGNPMLHRTLPVQNAMKGCLLRDDGTVYKYLNSDSWEDEVTDGSLGQVMVEIPEFYIKYTTNGTKRRVMISSLPLEGYQKSKKAYVGAYEATVQRSTKKLCSVKNSDPDYRGGNNNADWDGTYRSLLGKPASAIPLENFRQYAKNRGEGFTPYCYLIHKNLVWLYCIEYCSFNSQAGYKDTLTSEGYKWGGLGNGATRWNYSYWTPFNGNYPIINCGYLDELGNNTGIKSIDIANDDSSIQTTQSTIKYRGIEQLFGHCDKPLDGIIYKQVTEGGESKNTLYICDDPTDFSDYSKYQYVADMPLRGWICDILFGDQGHIVPSETSQTEYPFFDTYTLTINDNSTKTPTVGGNLNSGSWGGIFYGSALNSQSIIVASYVTRLCYLPN